MQRELLKMTRHRYLTKDQPVRGGKPPMPANTDWACSPPLQANETQVTHATLHLALGFLRWLP